ncbi:MAG: hypothetical protein HY262_00075 [Chloroflexi bacterium]|nr:hypothetical protein [Chloroflexota bacterium]
MISTPRHAGPWRRLAPPLALAVILAACSSGGSAATPGATGAPPVGESLAPSAAPSRPTAGQPGPGGPGAGDVLVVPKPGQLDVHPIAADSFAAQANGRHVVLTITYTSGVEPCSVLDTIVVERGEKAFAITLREGHGPGNPVCIMIARVMKAQVDLGELDPATYTITDTMRGADPIEVVVG